MEEQLLGRKRFEQDTRKIRTFVPQLLTPLQDTSLPYTSTSFDGDSFSTTAKTKIDLSATFGVPANVRAVVLFVTVRDSDSANADYYLVLSPNDTAGSGFHCKATHSPNDSLHSYCCTIPCDANGDIYYQIAAHGVDTFDVWIEVWSYFL